MVSSTPVHDMRTWTEHAGLGCRAAARPLPETTAYNRPSRNGLRARNSLNAKEKCGNETESRLELQFRVAAIGMTAFRNGHRHRHHHAALCKSHAQRRMRGYFEAAIRKRSDMFHAWKLHPRMRQDASSRHRLIYSCRKRLRDITTLLLRRSSSIELVFRSRRGLA